MSTPLRPLEIARKQGHVWYWSGMRCLRGHLGPRYVINRTCIDCNRRQSRDWRNRSTSGVTRRA